MESGILFVVMFGTATAIAGAILGARDFRRKRNERKRIEALAIQEAEERAARLADLTDRFGEKDAQRIIDGTIWQGQTREMLIEALGEPDEIDEKVTSKKTRHVFKYDAIAKNRFRLRVTLENDVVDGWEDKG